MLALAPGRVRAVRAAPAAAAVAAGATAAGVGVEPPVAAIVLALFAGLASLWSP